MKSYITSTLILGLAVSSLCAQEKPDLKNPRQRLSYSIGVDIANNLKRQDIDVDPKAVAAGLADAMAGKPALTEAEIKTTISEFRTELMTKRDAKQKVDGEKNLKEGETYLAANAKKDGVKSTSSGLQYKVLKSGNGKSPKA
ncbi:MAG TPA: FKBP-type peptidyl-prolyl cis-trans isomerase N-terminal domain-containing protein, partial [Verrucomicrobiae bacterium]